MNIPRGALDGWAAIDALELKDLPQFLRERNAKSLETAFTVPHGYLWVDDIDAVVVFKTPAQIMQKPLADFTSELIDGFPVTRWIEDNCPGLDFRVDEETLVRLAQLQAANAAALEALQRAIDPLQQSKGYARRVENARDTINNTALVITFLTGVILKKWSRPHPGVQA